MKELAPSLEAARPKPDAPAAAYDQAWLAEHLTEERRESALLGEIREIVFGAQDGLVSTLAVVATVAGATNSAFPIVVAGIAAALAGVFSMAAGEYIGSKSQREIFEAQIENERSEVDERPGEAEAEVAYMLAEEGLDQDEAARVAAILAQHPEVLLRTMVSKELGIQVQDEHGSPLQGALFMGAAFGIGAAVPIIPFLLVPIGTALPAAAILTGAVLFGIGVVKSRWTKRSPLFAGFEVLILAAVAGIAGYVFGTLLPALVGVAGITA
ncbi:MAG TPA: VIT1/CCC1 transporter family protein [Candidatus Limnocylindrales bacterium]|nr:VIT1/CCC1 transporter family protein [Candidatus Limnocylindrales bacterium]